MHGGTAICLRRFLTYRPLSDSILRDDLDTKKPVPDMDAQRHLEKVSLDLSLSLRIQYKLKSIH